MHGLYIGNNRMLISTVWNGTLIVPADDLSLMPQLVLSGAVELPLTKYLINHMKPGQTVVDIGANVGYYSVLFGMLVGAQGKVVAYEANPKMTDYLNDSLSINYLHDRTIVYNKAVYSQNTVIPVYANEKFKGNASIQKHNENYFQHYKEEVQSITIPAEKLDQLSSTIPRIDLLKIDIEGGEYHAFLGMEEYLAQQTIETIVFELNNAALQNDLEPFHQLLRSYHEQLGYSFYLIDSEGRLVSFPLEEILTGPGFPYVVMKPASQE
ncbi:FkbM family methyltransferase [Paenibacillus sp. UNC451MF]|uniref:FkbM family methyltransferase n=1 Tax=Paenibacillus sp. UNC451MF TaxID=1449063 RepID=UPI00048C1869|nr:FkbM family methyltransferase [Paenibacillus sp. UNC451MF]